jgi:DNA invertase Pin-like site-specific DNA recombinase
VTRVALYARVSTTDKGQDVENQLIPLRAAAAQIPDARIIEEYVEHESASGRVRRQVYERMLTEGADPDPESRKYDVLLFWSLDRFSREGAAPTLLALQRLTKAGVGWKSLQEPLLDTQQLGPFRDVLITLMAAIAQIETQRRSERAKAAIRKRIARGEKIGKKIKQIPERELRELRGKGYSNRALAKRFGVSRGTIINRLRELDNQNQSPELDGGTKE